MDPLNEYAGNVIDFTTDDNLKFTQPVLRYTELCILICLILILTKRAGALLKIVVC